MRGTLWEDRVHGVIAQSGLTAWTMAASGAAALSKLGLQKQKSRQDIMNDMPVDISEAEIPSLESEGELFMIDT